MTKTQTAPSDVIRDAQKLKKELAMESIQVQFELWEHSSEYVHIMMCSKLKNPINHQSKHLISASMPLDKYNWQVLELKLRAELLEQQQ